MPISSGGAYVNPGWRNGTTPYIDADELNAISNTIENVPVKNGGTGKTSHTLNAVLAGNGTSAVKNIPTANGALYATGADNPLQFGTLPIAQGGTGATGITTASINTGNLVQEGTVRKWGKIVTVQIHTSYMQPTYELLLTNCIPEGFRPTGSVFIPFVGQKENGDNGSRNTGVACGIVYSNGTVALTLLSDGDTPPSNYKNKAGYYHGRAMWFTNQ